MTQTPGRTLKRIIAERRGVLVPGAVNALSARIIEELGYEAVYVTGAGVTNAWYGLPDLGFIGLSDVANHTAAIRDAVELPLIVDADTGFGNALNVRHAVRTLERAGANAIQLEDQKMPKRCGHFSGKEIIPISEMVQKIKATADARHSDDFAIIARTDSRAVEGFDAAIARCQAFAEAGADVTFLEAPHNAAELAVIPSSIPRPQLVNLVIGGKTPLASQKELSAMGFALILYANVALQGAIRGMTKALTALKEGHTVGEDSGLVATFAERQALVRKPLIDDLERRYSTD